MPVKASDTPLGVDVQHTDNFFLAKKPNACFLKEIQKG